MEALVSRLRAFMEMEMRSCSMDVAGITSEYVQRIWCGIESLGEINSVFKEIMDSNS